MAYAESTYAGDEDHSVNCTGDACTGDEVSFERAQFTGSFRNARFAGFERVVGQIVAESYGETKQQHTFTLELQDGDRNRIKGRNLYQNGLWRRPWSDEAARAAVISEKHARGDAARADRDLRKA